MKPFIPETRVEYYFAKLSEIPRLSQYEKAASDYVMSVAESFGCACRQDDLWNVVVKIPAHKGYEHCSSLILQAHLDMVGVASGDHDFTRDPLTLYEDENGNIRAVNTTLGADDGYGCAYMLAIMEDHDFPHPPLYLVFTTQEENGCYGAQALDFSDIDAERMIGLDVMESEIENTCCLGCYCSDRITVHKEFREEENNDPAYELHLTGIEPVRTGMLVHPEQGNAIKLMARLLEGLKDQFPFRLVSLTGGEAENYNPKECTAVLTCRQPVEEPLRNVLAKAVNELDDGRQEIHLDVHPVSSGPSLGEKDSHALVDFLYLLPSANIAFSPKDNTLGATNNVGIVSLQHGSFLLIMSDRARTMDYKESLGKRIRILAGLYDMHARFETRYLPWVYNPESSLLKKTAALMEEFYGQKMVESICPGGLEICDFLPKKPQLDCVMFAPIGGECHSIHEWLNRASFNRVYLFLCQLLTRLAEEETSV
ncbi:MAG: M20/M25/M40 family metallo-hydrolase [Solobacterium sp.]|nr:M20/M25/M40 family metallo-hydrolase [Solobacterium sp.]